MFVKYFVILRGISLCQQCSLLGAQYRCPARNSAGRRRSLSRLLRAEPPAFSLGARSRAPNWN